MSKLIYLLDTNTISEMARNPQGSVVKRLAQVGEESVGLSIVVACEIRFGLLKKGSRTLKDNMEQILENMTKLTLDFSVLDHYADIRLALERQGTPIGANDLFIAAHARALDLVLVTNNTREFSRVPGLKLENWLI